MYKIVNLETFAVPDNEACELLKSEIGNSSSVLGLLLLDGFLFKNTNRNIEQLDKDVELHIIAGIVSNQQYKNVIHFDFMMHTVFMSYKNHSNV